MVYNVPKKIDDEINNTGGSTMTKTVIWSKNNCVWCDRAKQQLHNSGIPFEERNIQGSDWTKEQLLEAIPGVKTVPQIFMYGKYVGDYNALQQYYEDHNMNIGNGTL